MDHTFKLPPRLAAIAALVPDGARLADVGTDHALLPIRLLLDGKIQSAVATDIRPGPLSRAKENAYAAGVQDLSCVLCDGLTGVSPDSADTVVIAGMGGENIAAILRAAPWACRNTLCILQPMSRPEELRAALPSLGLTIRAERLLFRSRRARRCSGGSFGRRAVLREVFAALERHAVLRYPRGTGQTTRYRRSRSGTLRTGERP